MLSRRCQRTRHEKEQAAEEASLSLREVKVVEGVRELEDLVEEG